MKWIVYIALAVSLITNVWQWIDQANTADSSDLISRRNDSLQNVNVILTEKNKAVEARLDTTMNALIKSLSNTEPVKIKHEKLRDEIRSTSTDSLYNWIKLRANVQPDSTGN